nr:uncharacterized protein LOC110542665 [Meriones unguiculatus]
MVRESKTKMIENVTEKANRSLFLKEQAFPKYSEGTDKQPWNRWGTPGARNGAAGSRPLPGQTLWSGASRGRPTLAGRARASPCTRPRRCRCRPSAPAHSRAAGSASGCRRQASAGPPSSLHPARGFARGARIPLTRARDGASQHGASLCPQLRLHRRERARGRHGPRPRQPPGLLGPSRPRAARTRGAARSRPSAASETRALSETAVRTVAAPRSPTRGCVTGRHVRGRRGSSPARPRAQAQSAALRPAGRTTPSPPPPPRLPDPCGAPGAFVRRRTRPGPTGIRPVARGTRGGGGGGPVRRLCERCLPASTQSSPSHQRHSNILRV